MVAPELTLELLVASPTNLAIVLLPMTLATSTIGLYCIVAPLIWARVLFGIHVPIMHPLTLLAQQLEISP